jgi:hypothetical protein
MSKKRTSDIEAVKLVIELAAENARLKDSIGEAMYSLEKSRTWGGMDWHWHHPNAGKAWTILKTAMEAK